MKYEIKYKILFIINIVHYKIKNLIQILMNYKLFETSFTNSNL